jgi:hypothetical protein
MADTPGDPTMPEHAESPPDPGSDTGTPRWVKVAGVIALLVVVLFVIVMLTGRGGEHGPGRHAPGGDMPAGHTGPPVGVTHEQQQP